MYTADNPRDWLLTINNGTASTLSIGTGDHIGLQLEYNPNNPIAYSDLCVDYPVSVDYYNGNVASYSAQVSPATNIWTTTQTFGYDALVE